MFNKQKGIALNVLCSQYTFMTWPGEYIEQEAIEAGINERDAHLMRLAWEALQRGREALGSSDQTQLADSLRDSYLAMKQVWMLFPEDTSALELFLNLGFGLLPDTNRHIQQRAHQILHCIFGNHYIPEEMVYRGC